MSTKIFNKITSSLIHNYSAEYEEEKLYGDPRKGSGGGGGGGGGGAKKNKNKNKKKQPEYVFEYF